MSDADVARSALTYAVGWTVATAVAAVVGGAGVVGWVLPAYAWHVAGQPPTVVLRIAAPGLALVLLGLLGWKAATAVLHYRTLSAAFAVETAERLNTEAMKSDILSVMDERLADMKQDTLQTRRVVERVGSEEAADAFDFQDGRP